MPTPSMRIPASKVPVPVRRRAAQHLEAVRDNEMGVRARRARLADQVLPIYRPDLKDPAYYEFEVELGAATGFIVVSAGRHDYPVPHWSFDAEPVSRRLDAAAKASGGQAVARVYRLDALSYVAEDAAGQKVGQVGQIAMPIEGLPADLEPLRGQIATKVAAPAVPIANDNGATGGTHTVTVTGPAPPALRMKKVGSWQELRAAYATSLRPFLDELQRRAGEAWSIDDLVAKYGEGVMVGRPHRVALLEPSATPKLSGDAASAVKLERIERPGTPPVLELSASTFPFEHETDFTLTIAYASGLTETLPFFLVAPDTKSNRRTAKEA
jgi:hypothetical protein